MKCSFFESTGVILTFLRLKRILDSNDFYILFSFFGFKYFLMNVKYLNHAFGEEFTFSTFRKSRFKMRRNVLRKFMASKNVRHCK